MLRNSLWVSGSAIRNFMFCDPICDFLDFKQKQNTKESRANNTNSFPNKLFEEGYMYEEKVIKFLKQKYEIFQVAFEAKDVFDINKYNETKEYMEKKVEIIYQGVLLNFEKKIGGLCDLLVRSDIFNSIVKENDGDEFVDEKEKYYVLIDIKNSKLNLCKDGIHLQNSRNYTYYKSQLYIYGEALKEMQKVENKFAFILGKHWEFVKNKEKIFGSNPFQKMAKVDFEKNDSHVIDKANEAIQWVRKLRTEGEFWTLYPPSVPELRPNLKVVNDKWQNEKYSIAKKQEDVTLLYFCGDKKRKIADELGVSSFKNVCAKQLNIKSQKIIKCIERSIELQEENEFKILPTKICDENKIFEQEEIELYLDYETFFYEKKDNPCNDNQKGKTIVYLIGCGFVFKNENKWHFKTFFLKNLESEKDLFAEFLKELKQYNDKKIKIYSWGPTEKILFQKNYGEYDLFNDNNYIDILKFFKNHSITMTNVFTYSLKDIAKALYEHKKINSIWPTNNIKNGKDAMYEGLNLYLNVNENERMEKLKSVEKYNEIDCKVMWEIVLFLRNEILENYQI